MNPTQARRLHTQLDRPLDDLMDELTLYAPGTRGAGDVWARLAGDWKPANLDGICTRTVTLDELGSVFDTMLAGGSFGRTLVQIAA